MAGHNLNHCLKLMFELSHRLYPLRKHSILSTKISCHNNLSKHSRLHSRNLSNYCVIIWTSVLRGRSQTKFTNFANFRLVNVSAVFTFLNPGVFVVIAKLR